MEDTYKNNLFNNSLDYLRKLAIETIDFKIQDTLKLHPDLGVRRNLTLNQNIDTNIINFLGLDPTLNVSYSASKHPKCSLNRLFNLSSLGEITHT